MPKTTIARVGEEHVNQEDGNLHDMGALELLRKELEGFLKNIGGVDFKEIETRWGLRAIVKDLHMMTPPTAYARLVHEGDELSIKTGVESVDDTSCTFAQTATRGEDIICTCIHTLVLIDQDDKLAPIPDEWRKLLHASRVST